MKVCAWSAPHNTRTHLLDALARGAEASGAVVETRDLFREINNRVIRRADAHLVYSRMYNFADKVINKCNYLGKPVLVIDSGYVRRGEYYAVGLGGINYEADFKNANSPADRFARLGVEIKPWREGGEYVLLCGQRAIDITLPCKPPQWAAVMRDVIRSVTDLPILYRPYPSEPKVYARIDGALPSRGSLEDDLAGAALLVTHTSNVVINALLDGIPCVTSGHGVAERVVTIGLKPEPEALFPAWARGKAVLIRHVLDAPRHTLPDRVPFFNDLAYAQWTKDEMESGLPFRRLMGIEEPRKPEPIAEEHTTDISLYGDELLEMVDDDVDEVTDDEQI